MIIIQQFRRLQQIVALLQERESMTVHGISRTLDVSLATVRRDLTILEEDGLIYRTRGKAHAIRLEIQEPTMRTKSFSNVDKKEKIAQYAASLIKAGDLVAMDSGTTSLLIIKHINVPDVIVVTNGVQHLQECIRYNVECYMLPGMVKRNTDAVVGTSTINDISRFNFAASFIGTNGVSQVNGYTTYHLDEAEVKGKMLQQSKKPYILTDSTKLNKDFAVTFCDFEAAIMITEQLITDFNYPSHTLIADNS